MIPRILKNPNFWLGRPSYDRSPSKLSVTVVIPAWNEEDFIRDTIESVLCQSYQVDIIVVDDSSTDSTPDIVREYPSIRLITTDKNQGSKSRALNYAIPFVKTDIFICVDADTILDEDAVEKLLHAFNDEDTMVASGFVLSKNKENFWESGRFGEYLVGQTIAKSAQQNINSVMIASGCFFAIRTWFLERHKFSERTMAEDMDLTWVAIEHGFKVMFVEDAYCTVSDPRSLRQYDHQVTRWYRGFFQNLKVRNFNLFENSIKLGVVTYAYMFVAFIGLPLFLLAIILAAISNPLSFVVSFAFWSAVVWALVTYKAYKMNADPWNVHRHFFNSMLLSVVLYYVYIRSAFQELVLNKKLDIWIKGH